ncbi:MAG: hypothetical protein FWF36_09725 [Propionibacteriaceae bacterium]|nr:hypothetical protein [Propionibacteriaceae bacterium]
MAFNYWKFMASPHGGTSSSRRKRRGKTEKPGVPWFVSTTFVIATLRILFVTLLLLALAVGVDDPLPGWIDALIIAHGAAMIVALVFVLNGFGWARLAWAALSLAILGFVQDPLIIYVLVFDLLVLVVFVLPPSNRYMTACAAARHGKNG